MSTRRALLAFAPSAALALALMGAVPQFQPLPTLPPPAPTAAPTPVPLGEVRVSVVLATAGQNSPVQDAVVWIPGSAWRALPAHGNVASKKKRFEPRISAIPVGGTIDFPNLDRIHHNVFSLSPAAKFDLGLYKNGASRPMTFDNAGLVRIYCNIHPQMAAIVMVIDGRAWALTGKDGTATLSGVPPGGHPVKVWDERGGEWSGNVDVKPGRTTPVSVVLTGNAPRDVAHTRKDGTPYPPPEDDDTRY